MNDRDKWPEPCGKCVYASIEKRSGWQWYIWSTPIEAIGEVVAKAVVGGFAC